MDPGVTATVSVTLVPVALDTVVLLKPEIVVFGASSRIALVASSKALVAGTKTRHCVDVAATAYFSVALPAASLATVVTVVQLAAPAFLD